MPVGVYVRRAAQLPDGLDEHDWRPTTATRAVFKCQKCDAVGFAPHPLPHNGCPGDPA